MNTKYMIGLVVLFIAVVVAVAAFAHRSEVSAIGNGQVAMSLFSHISVADFEDRGSKAFVIDVRTPEEYVTGHIKNAMLVDVSQPDFKARVGQLDHTRPYYVYCQVGNRSRDAVEIMRDMGFAEVYGLEGGVGAWRKAGLPLE